MTRTIHGAAQRAILPPRSKRSCKTSVFRFDLDLATFSQASCQLPVLLCLTVARRTVSARACQLRLESLHPANLLLSSLARRASVADVPTVRMVIPSTTSTITAKIPTTIVIPTTRGYRNGGIDSCLFQSSPKYQKPVPKSGSAHSKAIKTGKAHGAALRVGWMQSSQMYNCICQIR